MRKQQKILIALKKARTSIDKIIASFEQADADPKCYDIMQQTLSAIGLLKNANKHILAEHLRTYLQSMAGKRLSKGERERMQEELLRIVETAQKK